MNRRFYRGNSLLMFLLAVVVAFSFHVDTYAGQKTTSSKTAAVSKTSEELQLEDVPEYSGQSIAIVNDNKPFFDESELTTKAFETYSSLDKLGRCGVAYANICQEIMPTERRGAIGMVKPSGWHTVKYNDVIDGNYLYNRCHLIGYQLAGENANTKNLITGTRWLNVEGMLPFENAVADYAESTGNHVLYRVTPLFDGNNLVASGVEIEAQSVEDKGEAICFNVYVYNIQPGIEIDYEDGSSKEKTDAQAEVASADAEQEKVESAVDSIVSGDTVDMEKLSAVSEGAAASNQAKAQTDNNSAPAETIAPTEAAQTNPQSATYILNTNTKKFHRPDCRSVKQMKDKNKQEYTGSRDDIIAQGYDPCKNCYP